MTKLEIIYSTEAEIERVKFTLGKLDWYAEKGYKVILPAGLSQSSTEQEIEAAVMKEYSTGNDYQKYSEEISRLWQEFASQFEEIKTSSELSLQDTYKIILTKYGTGGSYHTADQSIDVKFTDREVSSIFGTILHEIVHLAVEPLIKLQQIEHRQKERLVDLIGLTYFPDKRKVQPPKEDVVKVDEVFHKYFPNIKEVIKNLD